jgi:hypothetical protein
MKSDSISLVAKGVISRHGSTRIVDCIMTNLGLTELLLVSLNSAALSLVCHSRRYWRPWVEVSSVSLANTGKNVKLGLH